MFRNKTDSWIVTVAASAVMSAYVVAVVPQASAEFPGTPIILGKASVFDMTSMETGPSFQDYGWLSIMDPNSNAKLQSTFSNQNGYAGLPMTGMSLQSMDPNGIYTHHWDGPAAPMSHNLPPAMPEYHAGNVFHFGWDEPKQAWHWELHNMDVDADVWFTDTHPGGKYTVSWDGETVHWASGIAVAKVNGTIKYPGWDHPIEVHDWVGEQERMWGPDFRLGPGHNGYDYLQGGNPDGSADNGFVYEQLDGSVVGMLAHTAADGEVTICALDSVDYDEWTEFTGAPGQTAPYPYPRVVGVGCGGMHRTFTVDQPVLFQVVPAAATTTMSFGHTDLPGSISTIQHFRDDYTGWPGATLNLFQGLQWPPSLIR